ncbi:MAG: DUF2520 domain-containing protein [Pseudobutyrivibrio sp.]|nr:DUF2520 domain-containing protein [Pseudobutyrivibrio sp.]
MKVGFVGAGKVGCSLAMHFVNSGVNVIGFYSRSTESAADAAAFTKSNYFSNLEELIKESDLIFITVPDDAIGDIWDRIRFMPIEGKYISHCSGSLSSKIFSGIEESGAFGFSVHPLLAVSDRHNSYKELPTAIFTIEGDDNHLGELKTFLSDCHLRVTAISKEAKVRYHGAAVMASNLVVALIDSAATELRKCGIDDDLINDALTPLVLNNVKNVLANGSIKALTGPIERGDINTVQKHLQVLDGLDKDIYSTLSLKALEIARQKNPKNLNYDQLEELLRTS